MSDTTITVLAVRMPQVNVNDEEVTLVGWRVADGGRAVAGEILCEVETSKSVGEIPAEADGIVRHAAAVGEVIRVGEVFAYIGPSVEAIESYVAEAGPKADRSHVAQPARAGAAERPVTATAGAVELARRFGVDLSQVRAVGRIQRADVERYIAERGLTEVEQGQRATPGAAAALPPALAEIIADEGPLSDHQWAVAQHLARTQAGLVVAHVSMDAAMQGVVAWMQARRAAGVVTGPLPALMKAAGSAVADHPKLAAFRLGRRVYKYRSVDVAYTARSADGRLFTPVVRNVDRKSLDDLAAACGRLNMAVFRGSISPSDMQGACLTVSALSEQPVRSHVGLQNAYQSVLLTCGAIRDALTLVDEKPAAVPTATLTLSYDHGLMDGWEAAAALGAVKALLEAIEV